MRQRSIAARLLLGLAIPLLLAACATAPRGPMPARHADFLARLLVIDGDNRWQALVNWHAEEAERGRLRITHAATSRVVELRWQGAAVWLRDNQARSSAWRRIRPSELADHGIPLQPRELATFLLGGVPPGFSPSGKKRWSGNRGDSRIHVQWHGNRLTVRDATHGRQAVMIIMKDTPGDG